MSLPELNKKFLQLVRLLNTNDKLLMLMKACSMICSMLGLIQHRPKRPIKHSEYFLVLNNKHFCCLINTDCFYHTPKLCYNYLKLLYNCHPQSIPIIKMDLKSIVWFCFIASVVLETLKFSSKPETVESPSSLQENIETGSSETIKTNINQKHFQLPLIIEYW